VTLGPVVIAAAGTGGHSLLGAVGNAQAKGGSL
jgi:hypothetical protein